MSHIVWEGLADPMALSDPKGDIRVRAVDMAWVDELANGFLATQTTPEKIVAVVRNALWFRQWQRELKEFPVAELWAPAVLKEVISGAHSTRALKKLQSTQPNVQAWKKVRVTLLLSEDTITDRAMLLSLGIVSNVIAAHVRHVNGGEVLQAIRVSFEAHRSSFGVKSKYRSWIKEEAAKWQLTIKRKVTYIRQFIDMAKLPDPTWAALVPFFAKETMPKGAAVSLRPIISPHPCGLLKSLAQRDQLDLLNVIKSGGSWVALTNAIKTRIALRKLQKTILESARLRLNWEGPWTKLAAKYPLLCEATFVEAYTPFFLRTGRGGKGVPLPFTDQLNKRIDLVLNGRRAQVL